MNKLPTFAEIKEVAAKHSKEAIHDDKRMCWIFVKENGQRLDVADEYQYLPLQDQQEVLKGFKQWLEG